MWIIKIIFWRHVTAIYRYTRIWIIFLFVEFCCSSTATFKIVNSFFFQIVSCIYALVIRSSLSFCLFSICLVLLINSLKFLPGHLKFYIQILHDCLLKNITRQRKYMKIFSKIDNCFLQKCNGMVQMFFLNFVWIFNSFLKFVFKDSKFTSVKLRFE